MLTLLFNVALRESKYLCDVVHKVSPVSDFYYWACDKVLTTKPGECIPKEI